MIACSYTRYQIDTLDRCTDTQTHDDIQRQRERGRCRLLVRWGDIDELSQEQMAPGWGPGAPGFCVTNFILSLRI